MCGAWLGVGAWWIVPLIGFLICATFMVLAFRFMHRGTGMCMGGACGTLSGQPGRPGQPTSGESAR